MLKIRPGKNLFALTISQYGLIENVYLLQATDASAVSPEQAAILLKDETFASGRQVDVHMEEIDAIRDLDELIDKAVLCKVCGNLSPGDTAHRHDGGFVCEACWDERLRATE